MELSKENLRAVKGEFDAQAVYREIKRSGDFAGFARRFMHSDDERVARNAFWVLTKATLESMEPEFFKPAVNCVRNRILNGKL